MWKHTELNAYNSISLHDCRASTIAISGNDLVFDFPSGFWILPASNHINHDRPVKTGPSQLLFRGVFEDAPFDAIDVYKTTRIFDKPILCRRLQPEYPAFLKMFKTEKYELEFFEEYHSFFSSFIASLYQCWIWKKDSGMVESCQFKITAKNIEYRWNEILHDHE